MLHARANRYFRSVMTIFAIMVVALAALAPVITNALGSTPVCNWFELCSAQGTKRIAVNAAGEPISSAEQLMQHAEHCLLYHSVPCPATLPREPARLVPQPVADIEFPVRFYAASQLLQASCR